MNEPMEHVKVKSHGPADKAREHSHAFGDLAQAGAKKTEEAATGVLDTIKEKALDVASGASEMATRASDTAQEIASTAVGKVGEAGEGVAAIIRRYPLSAVCVGMAIGLGVGFLAALAARRA